MNFSELYMALQTGVVNGQDNPVVIVYTSKFYEVIDNFYRTNHAYNTSPLMINPQQYAALDAEDRALCDRLVKEILVDEYYRLMEHYNEEAEQALRKANVRVWEQDEIDMPAFYASADALVNDKYLKKEVFKKYILDIRKTYNY